MLECELRSLHKTFSSLNMDQERGRHTGYVTVPLTASMFPLTEGRLMQKCLSWKHGFSSASGVTVGTVSLLVHHFGPD